MARPTKLEDFKRFSLRLPAYLMRALKHEAIERDRTPNDLLNLLVLSGGVCRRTLELMPNTWKDKTCRYPWRAAPPSLAAAHLWAKKGGVSVNKWMIEMLHTELTVAGWVKAPKRRRSA